jgi:hypothetical protein
VETADRTAWAARLMTVARCRPPTGRPKEGEVPADTLKLYKAVNHLLVHGVNPSRPLDGDQVKPLWPLLDLFAPDENDRRTQARTVLRSVSLVVDNLPADSVHHHQPFAFWERVLTEVGSFTRKVREREGEDTEGKIQQTVKEFSELLACAIKQKMDKEPVVNRREDVPFDDYRNDPSPELSGGDLAPLKGPPRLSLQLNP